MKTTSTMNGDCLNTQETATVLATTTAMFSIYSNSSRNNYNNASHSSSKNNNSNSSSNNGNSRSNNGNSSSKNSSNSPNDKSLNPLAIINQPNHP